ncbi:hypothetical protein Y695_01802 [Hydrogenophaga sp. T4]|nr:hypothetical protein Y695_01802 [Hydrogenophaga sp. T4]
MALQDAPRERQTNTGTLELGGAVQALENAKQLLRILCIETHTVVTHVKGVTHGGIHAPADLDACPFARAGVFEGVAQQVGPDLPQQQGVALDHRQIGCHHPVDHAPTGVVRKLVDHGVHQHGEVHRGEVDRRAPRREKASRPSMSWLMWRAELPIVFR